MAVLEYDGTDEVLKNFEVLELNCPTCDKVIEYNIMEVPLGVVCPHCNTEIEEIEN